MPSHGGEFGVPPMEVRVYPLNVIVIMTKHACSGLCDVTWASVYCVPMRMPPLFVAWH